MKSLSVSVITMTPAWRARSITSAFQSYVSPSTSR